VDAAAQVAGPGTAGAATPAGAGSAQAWATGAAAHAGVGDQGGGASSRSGVRTRRRRPGRRSSSKTKITIAVPVPALIPIASRRPETPLADGAAEPAGDAGAAGDAGGAEAAGGPVTAGNCPKWTPGPRASAGSCRIQPGSSTAGSVNRPPSGCGRPLFRSKISVNRLPSPSDRSAIWNRNSFCPLRSGATIQNFTLAPDAAGLSGVDGVAAAGPASSTPRTNASNASTAERARRRRSGNAAGMVNSSALAGSSALA
jgi:hypothetical protein